MAILKCKMCGGGLEYDREHDLAICPYCGSKSTLFEQDRKLFEQFQNMFATLLNQEPQKSNEEGFWVDASEEELLRDDGETINITYLTKQKADLCTMYVAKKHVIYIFEKQHIRHKERYKEMIANIIYPNPDMERELSNYIPKLVTECTLADGRYFLAIEKAEGVYPLRMLGVLLDRHVAWVISRLENLCCLLDYNEIVLNGFALDNLFVDPANHQIYLYGGWWFSGYKGAERVGASAEVLQYQEKQIHNQTRNNYRTDLESLRSVAIKLLGYKDKEGLEADKLLPEPFKKFLTGDCKANAREDFALWDNVLEKSYGQRKFIPLSITEEEIYGRNIKNNIE